MTILKKEKIFHLFLYFLLLFSLVKSEVETTELSIGKAYNQTSFIDEKYFYSINLSSMKNITKIFIDIIIFTGDIEVNKPFTNNNDFVVDQYESINKIFISIKINQNPQLPDKFKSISNSFYKILYNFAVEGIDD